MRYVSIDIETSGLDPTKNSILSFAAIIEDTSKCLSAQNIPIFNVAIIHENPVLFDLKAAVMNQKLLSAIVTFVDTKKSNPLFSFITEKEVSASFQKFLLINGFSAGESITVAGKNFGSFDRLFLERLPNWTSLIKIHHRYLDPVTLFIDWKNDTIPPSLKECKERSIVANKDVEHNALDDAWDIILLLRTQYLKK